MKLELKHLAPYLPYGLQGILFDEEREVTEIVTIELVHIPDELTIISSDGQWDINLEDFKPLLIPLSEIQNEKYINLFFQKDDFLDEVTNSDNQFESAYDFVNRFKITDNDYCYPYDFFSLLFENHFDVFGLIPTGLAINKLTVK